MALTENASIPLGTKAPDFCLPDVISGKEISLSEIKGEKGTVIMFICNHCPYVKHIVHQIPVVAHRYLHKGIGFAAISSNDITHYPEDSPEQMKAVAAKYKFPFPYLYDQTQQVAKKYQAACTPEFFVYDTHLSLFYHGQFDDARPSNQVPVTGNDLSEALECLLIQKPVVRQKPSIGCSIKWKK